MSRRHRTTRTRRLAPASSGWRCSVAAAPFFGLYPVFVMKVLCFALFACAFNLLLGFTGLLSFGHAAFSARRPMRPATLSALAG